MEERELHFTKKRRHHVAPNCSCGQVNTPSNPFFSPFDEFDGQYGHCHKCDKTFMPDAEPQKGVVYKSPERKPQKFISPEPVFDWLFPDTTIEPKPNSPTELDGEYIITWYYRDIKGRLTSAKRMTYNISDQFKRKKEIHPSYPYMRDSGYYGCLFYERDLAVFQNATVILLESEKSAALLRRKFKAYLEEFIYLAVGGANGLTEDKMTTLISREVLIIYDCDNGEKQPDGTIKSPKGREAAEAAGIKLSAIASVQVVDLFPERNDGTDLGDIYKTIEIDYIRGLAGKKVVDNKLVDLLKESNRNGAIINSEYLEKLAEEFMIHPDKIQIIERTIQKKFASERGIASGPMIQKIEHWLSTNYNFRKNIIESRVYFQKKGEAFWRACNEADLWRSIHYDIEKFGKKSTKIPKSDLETILDSEFVPSFNPFQDYFETLPAWDGHDHIKQLADHVQTDDQPFWQEQFKKSLVRMLACTIGHIENRIIMTLVQEGQETGKSSFVRFLCPPSLLEYYKESPMEHSKDSDIALAENFIWNLEELADLNKKEIAEMKAFISRKKVKQRRAYARHEESMTRIVNFWGSTNKVEFLSDTQNTRWLCFNVLSVNHDYHNYTTGKKNVDINKVWAQAWTLYKSGFEYGLTSEERSKRDRMNHNFESMTDEKQLILRMFDFATPTDENAKFMSNLELYEVMLLNTSARLRLDSRNIGRSMSQLGFKQTVRRIGAKTVRGYWVKNKEQNTPIKYDEPTASPVSLFNDEEIELPF